MTIELLAKFTPAVSAFIGLPVAFLAWWTAHRNHRHQATKSELDALLAAAKESLDEPYRRFLLELHKEKLVGLAFRCPVPLDQVGKVMDYHRASRATAEEIGLAWPHRDCTAAGLSFRFDRSKRFWHRALSAYVYTTLAIATLMLGCAAFPTADPLRWECAALSGVYVAMAFSGLWLHRSFLTARHLSRFEEGKRPPSRWQRLSRFVLRWQRASPDKSDYRVVDV